MAKPTVAWQENKSMRERILYMLENEFLTDVCFEMSSPEGSITLVRAHKLFLAAASPVFETMFCGEMMEARPDCGNIKIEDINAEIFKEMIRFNCDLSITVADYFVIVLGMPSITVHTMIMSWLIL